MIIKLSKFSSIGALGLLKSGELDLYGRPSAISLFQDFLYATNPIIEDEYGQKKSER